MKHNRNQEPLQKYIFILLFFLLSYGTNSQKLLISDYLAHNIWELDMQTEERTIVFDNIRTFGMFPYQNLIVMYGSTYQSLYLVNNQDKTIERTIVFDLDNTSLLQFGINSIRGKIVAADRYGNLQTIDIISGKAGDILELGFSVQRILFSKDGQQTYILGYYGDIIIMENNTIMKHINMASHLGKKFINTKNMEMNYANNELYVMMSDGYNGFFEVLNLETLEKKWSLSLGIIPLHIVSITKMQKVFISCLMEDKLYIVDIPSQRVIKEIQFGVRIDDMLVDDTREVLYVLDKRNVHIFDLKDYHNIKSIKLEGIYPCGLCFSDSGKNEEESEAEVGK